MYVPYQATLLKIDGNLVPLEQASQEEKIRYQDVYKRQGYEACVHIYDYPEVLDDYWLTNPCNQENTIVTISIHNEDQNEVKKNLNRSIEEQGSRKKFAKEYKDFYDAAARESEMKALYEMCIRDSSYRNYAGIFLSEKEEKL